GDEETGVTIMQMDEGLDTGPILLSRALAIGKEETAESLHDRLAALGAEALVEALEGLAKGELHPRPQPEEGATYAEKLQLDEGRYDWRPPADELQRRVRDFSLCPFAWCEFQGERLILLAAELAEGAG